MSIEFDELIAAIMRATHPYYVQRIRANGQVENPVAVELVDGRQLIRMLRQLNKEKENGKAA